MKKKQKKAPKNPAKGRIRIGKNISLSPLQNQAVEDALAIMKQKEPKLTYSDLIQAAVETVYMSVASSETDSAGRLEARDRAIEFEEDCSNILKEAGFIVEKGAKVNDAGHRAGLLVKSGKGQCVIELKTSGRPQHLANVLGQAQLQASRVGLPVIVCVPYFTDPSILEAYNLAAKVSLATPNGLVDAVKDALKKSGN